MAAIWWADQPETAGATIPPVSSLRLRRPVQVRSEQKTQARGGNFGARLQQIYQVLDDAENLDDLRCQPLTFIERHRLNGRCKVAGDACKGTDLISADDEVSHHSNVPYTKTAETCQARCCRWKPSAKCIGTVCSGGAGRRTAEGEGGVPADLRATRSGALVQTDREAGAEVPGIWLALEQPSADARVQTPAQETVLSIKLPAI